MVEKDSRSPLEIYLFGPFDVRVKGKPLPRVRSHKVRWILALLALRHDREVEREWLAETLWPAREKRRALDQLRRELTGLRSALGEQAFRLTSPTSQTLRLEVTEEVRVDVLAYDAAIARGDTASLEEALSLYRGPLLEGCTEEWALEERAFREQALLSALETLAEHALERQDNTAALGYLRRAVAADPFRDSTQRGLMRAYVRSGDYAAAEETYRNYRRTLHREMNAEPDAETTELAHCLREEARQRRVGRAAAFPLSSPNLLELPHNLPQQTSSFIGREKEMAEVCALLERSRMLTLIGGGGCGKTRLCLQVASGLQENYPQGVWLVELASLADPELVPQTLAKELGVKEETGTPLLQTLTDTLKPRCLLLLLDNCEHLLDACAHLADALLKHCPHLQLIATSREALGIGGEQTYRVPSLSLPTRPNEVTLESLLRYEAVQLFIERALAVRPDFTITDQNARAITQVCQRLDGIPLAIELAAARVRSLAVEEIGGRLDNCFRLLTGGSRTALPRHRTLRSTIDWSYDLLNVQEKTLLCRVSVFAGGWTLSAAEEICCGEGLGDEIEAKEALDILTSLVDKNLVVAEEVEGQTRYRLLEMVRQYAGERLEEAERKVLQERYIQFFLKMAEKYETRYNWSPERVASYSQRLEADVDNLRAALSACRAFGEKGKESGLRLCIALQWFWLYTHRRSEGREHGLALMAQEGDVPTQLRAEALRDIGDLLKHQGDITDAKSMFEQALPLAREINHKRLIWQLISLLYGVADAQGDYDAMNAIYTNSELMEVTMAIGDTLGIILAPVSQARAVFELGDPIKAYRMIEEALPALCEFGRENDVIEFFGHALADLGRINFYLGEYAAARAQLEEGLAVCRQTGKMTRDEIPGLIILDLGRTILYQGEYQEARSLFEEGLTIFSKRTDKFGIAYGLEAFTPLAFREKQYVRAARLIGASARLRERTQSVMRNSLRAEYDRVVAEVREALGEKAFNAAWQEGHSMTLEQAVEYALEEGAE